MSANSFWPTVHSDGQRAFKQSANDLLDGLLVGYKHAAEVFRANPTQDNWRALVQAHAAWRVAFQAEDRKEPEP
jgi:hypothetical protein